jgi:hypothetical protein
MRDERGPGTWGTVVTVLRKDLLLELRGLDTLPAMVLFAIVTFVIFHFGLNQVTIQGSWPSASRAASTPSCSRRSTARRC